MQGLLIGLLVLSIVLPVGAFFIGERKPERFKSMLGVNLLSFFGMLLFATLFVFSGSAAAETTAAATDNGMRFIAAALATGMATIGAGIATGAAASAAIGALSENEGIMGKALILVALAEGIAIYGLIISIMVLNG